MCTCRLQTSQLTSLGEFSDIHLAVGHICDFNTSFLFLPRPRPIIIDGSNVAFAHSQSSGNHYFSSRGIDICVEYFKRRGHPEVIAFIPQHRMKHGQSVDRHLLEKLKKTGNLACTPSRSLQTQSIASYDDRYIHYICIENSVLSFYGWPPIFTPYHIRILSDTSFSMRQ